MKQQNWNPKIFIKPLEEGNPLGEWGRHLQRSRCSLPAILLQTEGQQIAYKQSLVAQEVVLHWVYKKKWNPSHQIPGYRSNPQGIKLIEPFSDVFLAWLNLCEAIHTIQPKGYVSAGQWFEFIARELFNVELSSILREDNESLFINRNAWRYANQIKNGKNPFCKAKCPHQWEIIESAIATEKKQPIIYQNFFKGSQRQKPYLGLGASYSALETSRQKAGHPSYELRDKVYMEITGRGKSRTQLVHSASYGKLTAETSSQQEFPDLIRNSAKPLDFWEIYE